MQETLLRAYRSIDRFDGRHPRAWLLTILRNANVNRTRRRRPTLFDGLSYQETADVLEMPIGTVMSRLHRARRRMREQLATEGLVARMHR